MIHCLLEMRKISHLHDPISINKQVGGLQVAVYYNWITVMQIIHSPGLKIICEDTLCSGNSSEIRLLAEF